MKIGVVTTSYPRFSNDPAGNFVGGHVSALRALGHSVDVLAAGTGIAPPFATGEHRIPSRLFYRGGAPDQLEASPLVGGLAAATFTLRMTAAVARRAKHWDLAIAHWLVPSAIAALPARVPLLAIAHGGDVHTLRRLHLLAPVLHALRARNARLVFVSEQLRSIARAAAPRLAAWLAGAITQPMGVALDRFARIARAPIDPPTIAIASRLVPIKGIDVALAALAHVRTPVRLVIAGDGPERDALCAVAAIANHNKKQPGDRVGSSNTRVARRAPPMPVDGVEIREVADSLGITEVAEMQRLSRGRQSTVTWLGEIDTTARDRLLGEASVVIVPSRELPNHRTEGTPLIALEALAAGVPVVASAVGGLRELAGLSLVPPDDPRALATAIDTILATPPPPDQLRQSVAHLDWPAVARRLLET